MHRLATLEVQEEARDLAGGLPRGLEPQVARLPVVPVPTTKGRGRTNLKFEICQLTCSSSVMLLSGHLLSQMIPDLFVKTCVCVR